MTTPALPQARSIDHSYGPERRIKKRRDFLRVQQYGRKYRGSKLLVIFSQSESQQPAESRLGVTITTKIDKRAVKRNRLRRRIREHFRRFRPQLKQSVDLVVIALSSSTELSYEELGVELGSILRRAKLL